MQNAAGLESNDRLGRRRRSSLEISVSDRILFVRFPSDYQMISWAPHNGGIRSTSVIFSLQVPEGTDCAEALEERSFEAVIRDFNLPSTAIGLMTAARVDDFQESFLTVGPLWVHAVATVGLTNARSILDTCDVGLETRCDEAGTINLVVASNAFGSEASRFEALHVASAAKATALFDRRVSSRKSSLPAALTGTDTIVVATSGEIKERFCGLHTVLGGLIGRSVYDVVTRGVDRYLQETSR